MKMKNQLNAKQTFTIRHFVIATNQTVSQIIEARNSGEAISKAEKILKKLLKLSQNSKSKS